jgi:hypothetical protein
MLAQFEAIPDNMKLKAIEEVLAVLNLKAQTPILLPTTASSTEKMEFLAAKVAELDSERGMMMQRQELKQYEDNKKAFEEKFNKQTDNEHHPLLKNAIKMRNQMLTTGLNAAMKDEMDKLLAQIDSELNLLIKAGAKDEAILQKIALLSEVALDLLEGVNLELMCEPNPAYSFEAIQEQIAKYQTVNNTANYCINSIKRESKVWSSVDKKPYVIQLMKHAMSDKQEQLRRYLTSDPVFIKAITENKSYLSSAVMKKSEGYYLLSKLFKRYGINQIYLTQTPEQQRLLALAQVSDFKALSAIVSKQADFTVGDALAPDEEGMTVLHYLMKKGHDEHAIEAIAGILQKSIGSAYNSKLDVQNASGQTPLDLLLENEYANIIIQKINDKGIKSAYGFMSGSYHIEHFFDQKMYSGDLIKAVSTGHVLPGDPLRKSK